MFDNRLTIILLVKGRGDFTVRWFSHAIENQMPFHVIVADGGKENMVERTRIQLQVGNALSYEYLCFPEDTGLSKYYRKVQDVLDKVKTPYVLLASNDDLIFFDTLSEDINFLDTNPHYVASRGSVWDLVISGKGGNDLYGQILDVSLLYKHESAIGSTAVERVENYSTRANSVWHDVVRTEALKSAYESLVRSKLVDYSMHESLISFYIACLGGINRRKEPYMLHQVHDDMAAKNILADSVIDWMSNPGWDGDLAKMALVVGDKIATIDALDNKLGKSHFLACYCKNIVLSNLYSFYATSSNNSPYLEMIKNSVKTRLHALGLGWLLSIKNKVRNYLKTREPLVLCNDENFKKVQFFLSKNETKAN